MPYSVVCPSCGTKAYLSRTYRSATALCRGCGAQFDVTASAGHESRSSQPQPITLVLNPDPTHESYKPSWPAEGPAASQPQRRRRRSHSSLRRKIRSLAVLVVLGFALAGFLSVAWYAGSVFLASPPVEPPARSSPEFLVARFDTQDRTEPSDREVYKFRFLIKRIGESYALPGDRIARDCIATARRLREVGVSASMTQILSGAIEAADNRGDIGLNTPSLEQYLESYEHYRSKGQDHSGTIETIGRLKLL